MIFSAIAVNVKVAIKPANINSNNEDNNTNWLLILKSQIVEIINPKIIQYINEEIAAVCSLITNITEKPNNHIIKSKNNLFFIF